MADTLEDLAARCESATGPDRELDLDIERTLYPGRFGICEFGTLGDYKEWDDDLNDWHNMQATPFTASLDAAMSLLDDNWFFHVSRFSPECDGRGEAHVYPNRHLGDDYEAEAATPALALCAAALRAIAKDRG